MLDNHDKYRKTMLTQEECKILNAKMHGTMVEALGIEFLPSDDDVALARMPITASTRQYFGILHGGASLTLAETVAGAGSVHLTGLDESVYVCGTEVSGTHLVMSATDGVVTGKARLLHAGKSTHVWSVEIVGEDGTVISVERVTNRIIRKQ